MAIKVCKFGGSSLADAEQIRKVCAIVQSDDSRRYIVPSAPGKRSEDDEKITDLLYECHTEAQRGLEFNDMSAFENVFGRIAERYLEIVRELDLTLDLQPALDEVKQSIVDVARDGGTTFGWADYAASRGEYLNSLILAAVLGYTFVDPAQLIFFDKRGRLDEERTYEAVAARLKDEPRAVIPGFYGSDADGEIKTFGRGGSDITGAIIARGVGAVLYENWTDVSGLLMADPRIVDNPKPIDVLTYRELRELAYMGATVMHDEAIFPVRNARPHSIPVQILNTNRPQDPGTRIVSQSEPIEQSPTPITGVAGRQDFTIIAIEKAMMNAEVGFARRLLSILEKRKISFEHLPSGIDTMSLVIARHQLERDGVDKLKGVLKEIEQECCPDTTTVYKHIALIATVGRAMAHTPGTAAKLFAALADANVNVRMIDQGSSELNIIVGVEEEDFKRAVSAIYHAFVE